MLHALCIGRWCQRRWSLCSGLSCGLETHRGSCLGPLAAEAPSPHACSLRVSAAPATPSHLWEKVFGDHVLPQQPSFLRSQGSAAPGSQPVSGPSGEQASVQAPGNHRQSWLRFRVSGTVVARPLRSLAHPQGPSQRAVDARVARSRRGAPACLSPRRRARPGLRAPDIHQESVGWIQRGAEGRQWRPKTWASRRWGV